MFPNFIIAGAEKAGTSSLVFYLTEHDDIYIPPRREIYFFNNEVNYKKGIEWYEKFFSGWSGEKAVGECTSLYMNHPECAQRIAEDFPNMKLIFILRNPVARAYSNYFHQVRGGKEFLSFEASLKREPSRRGKSEYHNRTYSYVNKGFYYAQLKRFTDKFPMQQILVIKLDDLQRSPQRTLNKIYGFLRVELKDRQKTISTIKNKTSIPRSKYLQYCARKLFGTGILFKAISKVNMMLGWEYYPPLEEETRTHLINRFANDIENLAVLTGMDFNAWKKTEIVEKSEME